MDKFNLTTILTAPRVGSDHNPLILDTGISQCTQHHFFRFNAHWLHQTGFSDWVKSKWPDRYRVDPLDHWHIVSGKLRRAIKGWGQNIDSQQRRIKQDILGKIELLDEQSDTRSLTMSEWEERYSLDRDLQQILADEELQWQRRGGEKWLLEGGSNSNYFHKYANGRKRKMRVSMLEVDGHEVVDPTCLKNHITKYYEQLFGKAVTANMHLEPDMWPPEQQIQQSENEFLTRPFSLEEVDKTMKEMKNNTTPGPDGFSVEFYKAFWPQIRELIKELWDCLHDSHLELSRLNYGVIILIPKVKPAINVKQFRPICLLNVIYKIITKELTIMLIAVVDKVISPFQTAFLLGRSILDGVVILQEILHELRSKKAAGVILILDLEKAYDKVSWDFLEETLQRKGFSETWIRWVNQAVRGGKVCIDLNGERGEYFRSFKGLRQGDPSSP